MLIIRLQRVGRTNDPSFRVIVTDSKNAAKTGKFLEIVGSYDARQGKPQFKAERIQEWIKNGAQVSETVHNLLVKNKIIEGKTIDVIPVKPAKAAAEVLVETPVKEEKAEEVTPAEAEEMIVAEEAEVSEPEMENEAPVETTETVEVPAEEKPAE